MRAPYTLDELWALLPAIHAHLAQDLADVEVENPNARPLPIMSREECEEAFNRLMQLASERALTNAECFLQGQLLANYRLVVRSETLGYKGRYWTLSESDLQRLAAEADV